MSSIPFMPPDLPLPMCAVCGHSVERMYQDRDILADVYTFSVHCHGEVERVDISTEAFAEVQQVTMGRAFEGPRTLGQALVRAGIETDGQPRNIEALARCFGGL